MPEQDWKYFWGDGVLLRRNMIGDGVYGLLEIWRPRRKVWEEYDGYEDFWNDSREISPDEARQQMAG